jgi:protein SCO1/2
VKEAAETKTTRERSTARPVFPLPGLRRLAAVLALSGVPGCVQPPREPPPVLAELPAFHLVDHAGTETSKAMLAGRPFVADFIFTRCVAVCPALTSRMIKLARELPPESRARLVSISVDPVHDRPDVLLGYMKRREISDPRWIFLTGERDEVWALIRNGFLLPVEEQDNEANPVLHSNRFALVDGEGRLRGTYEAFDEEAMKRLLADLAAIER